MKVVHGDGWGVADIRGRRVAIIADADETARILPEVASTAAFVKVFQRTPSWVVPTRLPLPAGRLRRAAARLALRRSVADPWLRRQLTPRDGGGRVVVRPGFHAALQQPNCKLYTWPVYALTSHGVRSAEGVEHRVDVVILGAAVEIGRLPHREDRIA